MDKALTDHEVLRIAPPGTRVFLYPQIAQMRSIDQLVSKEHPNAIILYQMEDDPIQNSISGHWTALKRINDKKICYFDSYGNIIDNPLSHIDKAYRLRTNQFFTKLSNLLGNSQYNNINYNEHKYQEHKRNIATCGRHSAFFCAMGPIDTDGYYDIMSKSKKALGYKSYDDMIVDLTNKFL